MEVALERHRFQYTGVIQDSNSTGLGRGRGERQMPWFMLTSSNSKILAKGNI